MRNPNPHGHHHHHHSSHTNQTPRTNISIPYTRATVPRRLDPPQIALPTGSRVHRASTPRVQPRQPTPTHHPQKVNKNGRLSLTHPSLPPKKHTQNSAPSPHKWWMGGGVITASSHSGLCLHPASSLPPLPPCTLFGSDAGRPRPWIPISPKERSCV